MTCYRTLLLVGVAALGAPGTASAALVAHFEAEGNALDSAGTNHGTLIGAGFAPGKIGRAFAFDGQNDYVSVPDDDSLDVDALTLAAWVMPEALGITHTSIVWRGRSAELTTNNSYTLKWQDDYPIFLVGTQGNKITMIGGEPIPLNEWTHLAGVYSGAAYTLYINGSVVGHWDMDDGPVNKSIDPLFIGASGVLGNPFRYFTGRIDDVRIYNHPLTAKEIASLVPEPTALVLIGNAWLIFRRLGRRIREG